jgi:hypothetical protein
VSVEELIAVCTRELLGLDDADARRLLRAILSARAAQLGGTVRALLVAMLLAEQGLYR